MFGDLETLVVWNPSAGSTGSSGGLKSQLESMPNVRLTKTQSRADCIDQIRRACEDGVETVIACGGDGTVNAVLEGAMRSEQRPVLGILPLGTGNDFTRSLGLNLKPAAALEQLQAGEIREVDVIHYTTSQQQGWYLNMLTGGNTGLYMDHLTDEVKRLWGPFCYLRGVIDILQELPVFEIEVFVDNQQILSVDALNIFLANGKMSGGGLSVCPEAEYDDGLIDLIVIHDGLPSELASLSTNYLLADYLEHDLVTYVQAKSIRIECRSSLPLTADGDRIGEAPLEAKVLHRALRMLVPPTAETLDRAAEVL